MHNIDSTALVLLETARDAMQQAIEDNSSESEAIRDVDALLRALQIVVLRHDHKMNATLMLLDLVGVSYAAFCAHKPDEYQAILTSALANIELMKNDLIDIGNR
jgi:hypothetical protein